MRLLAVDPSLVCSGWALFCDSRLRAVGKIRSRKELLSDRLSKIQRAATVLLDRCEMSSADILICEGPTAMKDPSAAIKVEQVRGIFECVARSRGVSVPGRVNPRSIHKQVLGMRGAQMSRPIIKHAIAQSVALLFASDLEAMNIDLTGNEWKKHQDVLDAILIGYLALKQIDSAQVSGTALGQVFEPRRSQRSRAQWGGGA